MAYLETVRQEEVLSARLLATDFPACPFLHVKRLATVARERETSDHDETAAEVQFVSDSRFHGLSAQGSH